MAITITNPQSRVVARAATLLISWTSNYPYNAYEIQYREASATAWSTFGRVTSTATSASISLSSLVDGCEYHYRVVLYSSNSTSGTTIYNGSQMSMAYSLVVTPAAKLGILKAKYGSKMVEVPVYTDSNAKNQVKIGIHGAQGHVLLGSDEEPTATSLKVDHPKAGNSNALTEKAVFRYSGIQASTYMRRDDRNTQYSYYLANKYDKTYQVGYYLSSYSYKYATYYKGYYLSGYGYLYAPYYRGTYVSDYTTQSGSYRAGSYTCGYYTTYVRPYYSCGSREWSEYYNDCAPYVWQYRNMYGNGYVYYLTPLYRYYCVTKGERKYAEYCNYHGGYTERWSYSCNEWKYYYYSDPHYSPYYGYYLYKSAVYDQYYGYYRYQTPNYNPYYNYYRYYAYYKHTYYTYTTTYHYS